MTDYQFDANGLARLDAAMQGYVDRGEVAGVVTLLDRHGEVQVDAVGLRDIASGAPMQRDTIFRIASMSKPVTAVAAMILVEETTLSLDGPVDQWLPELANRRVLKSIDGQLDDTVPANRPISLRDLLTLRFGLGYVMESPTGVTPIQQAIADHNLVPSPIPPQVDAETWLQRLGNLPLVHQPGDGWLYHTGSDVLGILVARASGMSLGDFLAERIFAPLGMTDTAFHVPDETLDRLATCYCHDPDTNVLAIRDPARSGEWSRPPAFESGAGGLVSTAGDFLAFARMLLDHGTTNGERILSRQSVELMTRDHITPGQKASFPFFPGFWDTTGWGFGMSIVTGQAIPGPRPGSYGWSGGFNTHWQNDPTEGMVGLLLVQQEASSAAPQTFDSDFWTLAYEAIAG